MDLKTLWLKRGKRCEYCHRKVMPIKVATKEGWRVVTGGMSLRKKDGPKVRVATRDHLHPKHAGGSNDEWNLRLVCLQCNRLKGGSVPLKAPPPDLVG